MERNYSGHVIKMIMPIVDFLLQKAKINQAILLHPTPYFCRKQISYKLPSPMI